LPFSLTSNGCAGDGTLIYIGASVSGGGDNTAAGRLACVDTADAYVPEVWTLVTGGVTGNPAYASGVCFTGGEDGGVYAVDSGRHSAWSLSSSGDRFMTDAAVVGNVVVDGPAVFVSSMDTRLYSIDRLTGKLRWEYFAQAPLPDGPVVTLSNVYQLVPGTGMVAIARTPSAETIRHPAWTNADAVQVLAEDDRNVYLQMKDNSLQAANKNTGAMVWQSAPTNFVAYAPDLSKDGFFYAATADGRISQIKPVLSPGVIGEIVPQRAADQAPAAK
jgi:outer membrane protein assembly factor BamB